MFNLVKFSRQSWKRDQPLSTRPKALPIINSWTNWQVVKSSAVAKNTANFQQTRNLQDFKYDSITRRRLSSLPKKGQKDKRVTVAQLEADRFYDMLMMPNKIPEHFLQKPQQHIDLNAFFLRPIIMMKDGESLLRKIALTGDVPKAFEAFTRLKERYEHVSEAVYSQLILACAKSPKPMLDKAFEVLDLIKKDGYTPSVFTFTHLVSACVRVGRLDRAFLVLTDMQQLSIHPDSVFFTTLLRGCVFLGDFDRAWKLFNFTRSHNLMQPDRVSYATMIDACAKDGRAEQAVILLRQMQSLDIEKDDVIYNTVLKVMAKRPDYYNESMNIVEQMKSSGFIPDMYTLGTLLAAAANSGDIESAERLFAEICSPSFPQKPAISVFNSMIKTLAKGQKWGIKWGKPQLRWQNINRAEEVFALVSSADLKPDQVTVSYLLQVYTEARLPKAAQKKWETLFVEHGLTPQVPDYSAMIKMHCNTRRIDDCFEKFLEMKKKKIRPDYSIYKWMLQICGKSNQVKAGWKMLKETIAAGYKPQFNDVKPLYIFCNNRLPGVADDIWRLCEWPLPLKPMRGRRKKKLTAKRVLRRLGVAYH